MVNGIGCKENKKCRSKEVEVALENWNPVDTWKSNLWNTEFQLGLRFVQMLFAGSSTVNALQSWFVVRFHLESLR